MSRWCSSNTRLPHMRCARTSLGCATRGPGADHRARIAAAAQRTGDHSCSSVGPVSCRWPAPARGHCARDSEEAPCAVSCSTSRSPIWMPRCARAPASNWRSCTSNWAPRWSSHPDRVERCAGTGSWCLNAAPSSRSARRWISTAALPRCCGRLCRHAADQPGARYRSSRQGRAPHMPDGPRSPRMINFASLPPDLR